MARMHLFEFEDQRWFPSSWRNYGTDFLQFLANKTKLWKPIVPVLGEALKAQQANTIVDLGSGGGGGVLWLNAELLKQVPDLTITLTDYYPNIPAFERTASKAANIRYAAEAVDARDVPASLSGFRTQFLSLHHFKPEDARKILQNAVDTGSAIGIFEAQERSLASILAMVFSPITVLLTTPFIRPFALGRIVFTYLLPVVPLFVMWDGVVSALRTYSVDELKALVAQVNNHQQFHWQIERVKNGPAVVIYCIGTPKA